MAEDTNDVVNTTKIVLLKDWVSIPSVTPSQANVNGDLRHVKTMAIHALVNTLTMLADVLMPFNVSLLMSVIAVSLTTNAMMEMLVLTILARMEDVLTL